MNINRHKANEKGVGPATIRPTTPIPIADDNLVCIHCGKEIGANPSAIISSPKRKGIIAFACYEHIAEGLAYISKALDMAPPPTVIKVPDPMDN